MIIFSEDNLFPHQITAVMVAVIGGAKDHFSDGQSQADSSRHCSNYAHHHGSNDLHIKNNSCHITMKVADTIISRMATFEIQVKILSHA